jgi:hypothetical protein
MMKKEIAIFGCLILLAFILGCTGGESTVNETKLEVNQGLGIVGSLKIDALNPGLDGYISLTVRNNLGGENAKDIYVGLDNIKPFKIVECGEHQPQEVRKDFTDCIGMFNMDKDLPFRLHGTTKMFPGEETEYYWRLRAPSADEISEISLKHPIYYDLEYSYKTSLTQNIIFMSQQEVLRRRQSSEAYEVSGETKNSAGELKISGTTAQPIVYFFSTAVGSAEPDFSFALQYHVENSGTGIPLSDVVVMFEIPKGNGIDSDATTMTDYGWQKWNDWDGKVEFRTSSPSAPYSGELCTGEGKLYRCYCRTGKTNVSNPQVGFMQNCKTWVTDTYGGTDEFKARFGAADMPGTAVADGRLLVKVVKREDFISSFDVYMPLILQGNQLKTLKDSNIPIQLSTFKTHTMYRYFTEGKDYITVYPIKI